MKDFVLSPQTEGAPNLKIDYQNELNDEQYQAVMAGSGPALVLAGAGSGKTRTITYRVAWLLEHGVPPDNILLLTFTNKAANEMVQRIDSLLSAYPAGLWAGTFHSVANRLLRRYASRLGYGSNFSILDEDDSKELVSLCVKELKIDVKGQKFPSSAVLRSIISFANNKDCTMGQVLERQHPRFISWRLDIENVANLYRQQKLSQNAMDFDDLLLKLLELLKKDEEVRNHLSEQFQYILVDEFQDTNVIQASIVQLLAAHHGNVLAVGDDAQSIYSFRAAEIRNMLDFPNLYAGTAMYRLTTNYRSTPQILAVANAVIKNNSEQFSKELKTSCDNGEKPSLVAAASPSQEAQYIADQIASLLSAGAVLPQIAVLFRSSFHSQSLEFELMRRGISYEYRGGMKFFERAHIKDAIAHLRLMHNHKDGMAWVRCLKIHPGIGLVTAGNIASSCSQAESLDEIFVLSQRGAKADAGWKSCLRVVEALRSAKYPSDAIRAFCKTDEYSNYLEAEYPDASDRLEDLEQFAVFAEQFQKYEDFLEAVTLTEDFSGKRVGADPGIGPTDESKLILTTIHQAKGLEWDHVFVIHLAEGSFPHSRAMSDAGAIEEERRLFYVASTRARKNLYLTYPATTGFDTIETKQPSMFLAEIPEGCYERVRLRQPGWLPSASSARRSTWVEDSNEPTIVLDDLGERVKKPMPKSFLGDY